MAIQNLVAIVTARGGSKGIPGKNIIPLAGKPLIAYSIEAALGCECVSSVIVTTDDAGIANVSRACGARVIDRPKTLATATARSEDVVRHVLESMAQEEGLPESFVLLQPTSPLRNAGHLREAVTLYHREQASCLISVTEVEHHPYKNLRLERGLLKPLFEVKHLSAPRQTLPQTYRQNGAVYIMNSRLFLQSDTFFVEPVLPFIMDWSNSVDIDEPRDLVLAEQLLRDSISCSICD